MNLIVYYVVFMIIGDLAAYFVGLITERTFGSQASFIVFLTLYFLFLWVSWVFAVRLTEPNRNEPMAGSARYRSERIRAGIRDV